MRIKLEKRWIEKLLRLPESGMGYQRVDLRLEDGREVRDVPVFNAEEVELPREFDGVRIAGVEPHPA